MNAVDGSDHFDAGSDDPAPSLLTIVLDTNPHAWALLEDTLPLSKAVANILVFINAHLACNYANKVAVVASHSQQATWLYPTHASRTPGRREADGDVEMSTEEADGLLQSSTPSAQANKYPPFRIVEEQLTCNLKALLDSTQPSDLSATVSTMMAGALTLALSHINRESIAYAQSHGGPAKLGSAAANPAGVASATSQSTSTTTGLQSRILVISVSSSTDSAHQYIPIMNAIFACQRLHIPIDICKLSGDAVFLQQASDATKGIYMSLSEPRGLLQYLMMAFLPDQRSRKHLVLPTRVDVDFRAACFCHRKVVNVGFVCSICLSIFCEPPQNADCLTCGTHLELGNYGAKPAVLARKKKKKKARANGASNAATPSSTPGP